MTNEDHVTYEIAQALKKAGFDWPCKHYYTKENVKDKNIWFTFTLGAAEDFNRENIIRRSLGICSAPTLVQAQKWLREIHGVHVEPRFVYNGLFDLYIVSENRHLYKRYVNMRWTTYESALSVGIEAALRLIEEDT